MLPDRATWWPAERVLFVADVHLGKPATYSALGQPVPKGTTRGCSFLGVGGNAVWALPPGATST
jgi:hypothetical protein